MASLFVPGYHHETRLLDLVSRVKAPVYLASNSPSSHVYKVLAALGMTTFGWAGIITPDTSGFLTKGDALFWSGLLAIYPKEGGHSIWLADDSRANLKVAASVGIRGLPVGGEGGAATVQNAVCTFMGLIPSPTDWSFDPIKYIQSKNVVDRVSLCSAVKHALKTALESLPISNKRPMRIVDVGAGLLNMLEEAQSIASELEVGLEYQALETEEALFDENLRRLSELGFQSLPQEEDGFTRMRNDGEGVTVVLRKQDFRKVARGEFKVRPWRSPGEQATLPRHALLSLNQRAHFISLEPVVMLVQCSQPRLSPRVSPCLELPGARHCLDIADVAGCRRFHHVLLLRPHGARCSRQVCPQGLGGGQGGSRLLAHHVLRENFPGPFSGKTTFLPTHPPTPQYTKRMMI